VDSDGDNTLEGAAELALRRELEACDVRLRLLECLDGQARGDTLVRELQLRREEAELELRKLRSKSRHSRSRKRKPSAPAAEAA
jgi:hypothetical protein